MRLFLGSGERCPSERRTKNASAVLHVSKTARPDDVLHNAHGSVPYVPLFIKRSRSLPKLPKLFNPYPVPPSMFLLLLRELTNDASFPRPYASFGVRHPPFASPTTPETPPPGRYQLLLSYLPPSPPHPGYSTHVFLPSFKNSLSSSPSTVPPLSLSTLSKRSTSRIRLVDMKFSNSKMSSTALFFRAGEPMSSDVKGRASRGGHRAEEKHSIASCVHRKA